MIIVCISTNGGKRPERWCFDRNHPSVIIWSIGNEVIERKEPEAVEIAHMMAQEIKKLDTIRPVTSAMTTWDNEWEIFDPLMEAHDVCGYNYQLHRANPIIKGAIKNYCQYRILPGQCI